MAGQLTMGDSLKEFLAARARPLDDIPSERYPDGHSYLFTAPSWKTCLALKAIYVLGVQVRGGVAAEPGEFERLSTELIGEQVEDATRIGKRYEELLYRKVLGDTYDQLVEDGVDGDTMEAVFQLLLKKYGAGQDIATQIAQAQPDAAPPGEPHTQPEKPKRNAAAKRAGSKSSPASGATKGRTRAASTSASTTPVEPKADRKTA